MTQLGGHAIYLTEDVVMGAREAVRDVAKNLERFVDAIMARTGPHEVVTELAARPRSRSSTASRPRASLPGPRRPVHAPRAVRRPARRRPGVRRRWQQRLPLARAPRRDARHRGPPRASAGLRADRAIVARARELASAERRAARLHGRSGGGGRAAPRSSIPTRGPRWARRPRPRSAARRSRGYQVNAALLAQRPTRASCIACPPTGRGDHIRPDGWAGSLILEQSENRLHAQKASSRPVVP